MGPLQAGIDLSIQNSLMAPDSQWAPKSPMIWTVWEGIRPAIYLARPRPWFPPGSGFREVPWGGRYLAL